MWTVLTESFFRFSEWFHDNYRVYRQLGCFVPLVQIFPQAVWLKYSIVLTPFYRHTMTLLCVWQVDFIHCVASLEVLRNSISTVPYSMTAFCQKDYKGLPYVLQWYSTISAILTLRLRQRVVEFIQLLLNRGRHRNGDGVMMPLKKYLKISCIQLATGKNNKTMARMKRSKNVWRA